MHRPRPLSLLHCPGAEPRGSVSRRTADLSAFQLGARLFLGATQPPQRWQKRRRAPSAGPRGAQPSLRAPHLPSDSALPAAGGDVRRRRQAPQAALASAASGPPSASSSAPPRFPPPTSRAPACPGHAWCCCRNKEVPRGGGGSTTLARGSYLLPARGGDSRASG